MRKQLINRTDNYSFSVDQIFRATLYINPKLFNYSRAENHIETDIEKLRREVRAEFKEKYPDKEYVEREWYLDEDDPTRILKSYKDCFESCLFTYEIRVKNL